MKLPQGWESKTIGETVSFSGGSQPPRSTFENQSLEGYVRLIQIRDYKTDKYATYIPKSLARKFCSSDDIMIGRYGPPVFQILKGIEGAYNVALIKAKPLNGLSKTYLYYFLKQECLLRFIERFQQRSSGQTGIEMDVLKAYPFPLPPKDERREIAEILGCWDSGIERLDKLIDAKRKLKKGLMQQLLTGKKRFKEFKGQKWKEVRLGDFLIPTIREIPKPSEQYLSLGLRSHGKGVFHKPDFDPNKIAMEKLYEVQENDLIVNITFAWEGAIAIVGANDVGGLVSHRFPTYVFNEEIVLSEFMRHVIRQKYLVFQLGLVSPGGAGRNRVLKKTDFLKINLSIPDIAEQQKIASVLNAADKEIELLCDKLEVLKNQKKGLMQKLLTGKIRVKV